MIKDIVVHLTGSPEDTIRLKYAAGLAERLDAHLTGLQVNVLPGILSYTDVSGSVVLQELIANANKQADEIGERLRQLLSEVGGIRSDLRRVDAFPEAVGSALASEARLADLFIGTRPYGDPVGSAHIEESVLFEAGRACIFLPPKIEQRPQLDRIVVGWKNTRESARAVAEAMPLLRMASSVDVILVSGEGSIGISESTDIGTHLARHGVTADIRTVPGEPDTASALLREAHASSAGLLVMGAYGHSRLRETILGGATRDVLTEASIPVFMAH